MRFIVTLCLAFLANCAYVSPRNSVFQIQSKDITGTSRGTAFAISPHLAITAAHVCNAIFAAPLTIDDEAVTVVKVDEAHDLCLIRRVTPFTNYLKIAKEGPAIDAPVNVWGYPLGVGPIHTKGEFSSYIFMYIKGTFTVRYMASCPIYGGNSGGPMLNADNEVIGVVVMGMVRYPQISIAITLFDLRAFLELP